MKNELFKVKSITVMFTQRIKGFILAASKYNMALSKDYMTVLKISYLLSWAGSFASWSGKYFHFFS